MVVSLKTKTKQIKQQQQKKPSPLSSRPTHKKKTQKVESGKGSQWKQNASTIPFFHFQQANFGCLFLLQQPHQKNRYCRNPFIQNYLCSTLGQVLLRYSQSTEQYLASVQLNKTLILTSTATEKLILSSMYAGDCG